MIYCDFCVLSPLQRRIFLRNCCRSLKPDGRFLFDVWQLSAFEKIKEMGTFDHQELGGFWSADEYICLMNTYKYEREKVSLELYTILQPEKNWQIYNWLQNYSVDSLDQLLGECGLEIAETFGNVAGDPYLAQADEFAVTAQLKKFVS